MYWSHAGQKDRFVIFGRGALKMAKKSWREAIGVKVRSEILSSGQNFLFWPIWFNAPPWHSAACRVPFLYFSCRVPPRHFGFVSELYASGAYSFAPGFFTHFGRPTAENYESVFLTVVRPKPGFGHFEVQPWVKFSEFWPGGTSELYANGPESFPLGFFTPYQNLCSVFLTVVRPGKASKICD